VHILGTAFEWIMCLTFLLYFLTFHVDFAKISVDVSIKIRYHHMDGATEAINEQTPLRK
jgi:hypothetical protein